MSKANHRLLFAGRCAGAACATALVCAGCNKNAPPIAAPAIEAQSAAVAQSATTAPASHQVVIDNFTFSPVEMTIPAGTSVTWVNHDDVPHTATSSDTPRAFNSGALDTDGKFTFEFKTPGTYPYFCAVHTHMTGKIIVQ